MGRITLVTGGSRSGKSSFAQKLAEETSEERFYIATAPVTDHEMANRIELHKKERLAGNWQTIEEELRLKDALQSIPENAVVIIDCLTLWVNNLLYDAGKRGVTLTEEDISEKCHSLSTTAKKRTGDVIFVTNEVGMGIVPENEIARRFRDLTGRCNQVVAKTADHVILMVCGIPTTIK
ncbi:MAG: bifunctional adenosylcobinamide kinase/adenosylcobinamide-phosphate guanylyltransferase [Syntrophales bacterium]|nr:bifunctional adenosylcobinamide kinase/adenosylcobinamide-phosphate guanylyltransferase [Syntrophales bacterium]